MPTDVSEKGLEVILVAGLCERGWTQADTKGYNSSYAIDLEQLRSFLEETQPQVAAAMDLANDSPVRNAALSRIQGQITDRGIIDVLRKGIKHGALSVDLFYGSPSEGNALSQERFKQNRFTVVRQLHFSPNETALSLDVCLFINGLPVITKELKNNLTKQNAQDAIEQYKNDRDPRELIFRFGRTLAHFALDDKEVWFCTELAGEHSWFLPFNKGHNDGAGNPPNPAGLMTSYLWEDVLTPEGLTDIIENYALLVTDEVQNRKTKKMRKTRKQIFPRYHQLAVVRELLLDVATNGPGRRYLLEHSAGSGKSNEIAWLAHQLIRLEKGSSDGSTSPLIDSVIVVTDRRNLDKQINNTIKQFAQVGSIVGHADHSSDLQEMLTQGKKIIITTVQKFPFILGAIGDEHRERNFAVIIDEAHSSQSGRSATALARVLQAKEESIEEPPLENASRTSSSDAPLETDDEDEVQDLINAVMHGRKMAPNASYFAFTATPKNKTLEMFGSKYIDQGEVKFKPFHTYSMKQAISEGFILDVLANYTPVNSYYKLVKTIDTDPEYDVKRAKKKLRSYVEGHDRAISVKAEIMVDHFFEQFIAPKKLGGQSRAMVVTGSIERAIQYYQEISRYLKDRGGQFEAIVAFSGDYEYGGTTVTESSLNGFPSSQIEERVTQDPYRFLVCAEKFQTGYDEPLLQVMYVDKALGGVKAVQTLQRLNRAAPKKHDVFVLDFQNNIEDISASFAPFYRTTILAGETDANKLHDLQAKLDDSGIYTQTQVKEFVELFLTNQPRTKLDPILDICAYHYSENLDEDGQIEFKGAAKAFTRTYDFLGAILPYTQQDWEELSIFLNLLIPKLPAPVEEDLARGILDTIDMDSYRAEKLATAKVQLPDADGALEPVPTGSSATHHDPELDKLSNIVKEFNDLFGNIDWTDIDRIQKLIINDIRTSVSADPAYQNAIKNNDKRNARIEMNAALTRAIVMLVHDNSELFKQFQDNPEFKNWLSSMMFELTYENASAS